MNDNVHDVSVCLPTAAALSCCMHAHAMLTSLLQQSAYALILGGPNVYQIVWVKVS